MTPNTLAFTGLAAEYCQAAEAAAQTEARDFAESMLRLLPRLYMAAQGLDTDGALDEGYIDQALDEDSYEAVRGAIAVAMGEDDTFLEVFEQDMKYSETPIAATVSELLADLYQVFYNYLSTVREAPDDVVASAVAAVKEEFASYWSQTLCNVLRPLNSYYYNSWT